MAHSSVREAANGRIGLEMVQQRPPDLILLDLMMPEMDGFAVLDALRTDQELSRIPVIVVTAKELTHRRKAAPVWQSPVADAKGRVQRSRHHGQDAGDAQLNNEATRVPAQPLGPLKILYIEDDPNSRRLVQRLLRGRRLRRLCGRRRPGRSGTGAANPASPGFDRCQHGRHDRA